MSRGTRDGPQQSPGIEGLVRTCSANVQRIAHRTAQMKTVMKQLESRTVQEDSELQDKLMQLQQNANHLTKETCKHMKDLVALPLPECPSQQVGVCVCVCVCVCWQRPPTPVLPVSLQRQQKIQRERLLKDFTAALEDLQAVQRRVSRQGAESAAKVPVASRLSGERGGRDNKEQVAPGWGGQGQTCENHLGSLCPPSKQDSLGQHDQSQESSLTQEDLEMVKERQANLLQLESDIMDVAHIFKDLTVLIQDQGDMLDSIQANVESTQERVEQGVERLHRATSRQQSSRKKMCFLALMMSLMMSLTTAALGTVWESSA
ncbi:syntaxin-12-like isoform X3 [Scleropages formosus]|nr:syntaxin-12-like isoform X3 [Scleropages formosus]XP_029103880.1 syntaxin-12-like isoform X3 [Scleropages formosus]XP_029103881.1 syntaxin-12-like isoform X3 [Scleropages formosus]XP_029103882.1 syntaxin-12-like isoform X3 [Scleropages formosus]XP_029103883.1 syntaxin-12-like isoform X3 [Scleropages formosus]